MATGFQRAQVILAGAQIGLYDFLIAGPKSVQDIQSELKLHNRMLYDYLDTLVTVGVLERKGFKDDSVYNIADQCVDQLDRNSPNWIGGLLISRQDEYVWWGRLSDMLKTGENTRQESEDVFGDFFAETERKETFMSFMSALQRQNFLELAKKYDFSQFTTLCDIGGASASLSITIAAEWKHLRCFSCDLEDIKEIAERKIEEAGLTGRITPYVLDFFKDEFPKADIITMGNILHDWDKEEKLMLMQKAYNALPEAGALMSIEDHIDNDRRTNTEGLIASLNMGVVTPGGYNWSESDFQAMAREVGFTRFELVNLTSHSAAQYHHHSAAIAYK